MAVELNLQLAELIAQLSKINYDIFDLFVCKFAVIESKNWNNEFLVSESLFRLY